MTSRLIALTIAATEPHELALFWAHVLRRTLMSGPERGVELLARGDTDFALRFEPTQVPKAAPNQMHLDLTSMSLEDQRAIVARALDLGARPLDIGQGRDAKHVVLADLDGNEFCVIEPDNAFLADCPAIGAVSCDGSREVGRFFSQALDWPLVWDQGRETAIRSPQGGSIISWGGPSTRPKTGPNRWHFDLTTIGNRHDGDSGGSGRTGVGAPEDSLAAEVQRLLSLGARRLDIGPRHADHVERVLLADPDGNEFCLSAPE